MGQSAFSPAANESPSLPGSMFSKLSLVQENPLGSWFCLPFAAFPFSTSAQVWWVHCASLGILCDTEYTAVLPLVSASTCELCLGLVWSLAYPHAFQRLNTMYFHYHSQHPEDEAGSGAALLQISEEAARVWGERRLISNLLKELFFLELGDKVCPMFPGKGELSAQFWKQVSKFLFSLVRKGHLGSLPGLDTAPRNLEKFTQAWHLSQQCEIFSRTIFSLIRLTQIVNWRKSGFYHLYTCSHQASTLDQGPLGIHSINIFFYLTLQYSGTEPRIRVQRWCMWTHSPFSSEESL